MMQLEEEAVLLKFNKDQADALAWLAAKLAVVAVAETAADVAGAQKLLRKHADQKVPIPSRSLLARSRPRPASKCRHLRCSPLSLARAH